MNHYISTGAFIVLPPPIYSLAHILAELKSISNERLDEKNEHVEQNEEVRGLKFISNRLAKLFDKNRKMQYNTITKILINNFASESNDSRNIKRRVYDAINVMVAAGVFEKNDEFVEKTEPTEHNEAIKLIKKGLDSIIKQKKISIDTKRQQL